jgi:hypothetical protein
MRVTLSSISGKKEKIEQEKFTGKRSLVAPKILMFHFTFKKYGSW